MAASVFYCLYGSKSIGSGRYGEVSMGRLPTNHGLRTALPAKIGADICSRWGKHLGVMLFD